MFLKSLLVATLVGGLSYVFAKARQEVIQDRQLDKQAKSRWEDEGGPAKAQAV